MTAPTTLARYAEGQAAVAASTGALDLLAVGDSLVEGNGVDVAGRWVTKLRDLQRARWQPSGVPGGAGYIPSNYFGAGVTNPWVYSGGTPNRSNQYGLGHRHHHWASGSIAMSLTFTGTRIQLLWARSINTGSVGISIDSGPVTTVNTAAGAVGSTPYGGGSWTSPALAAGQHTVRVTNTSGKTVLFSGAAVYNGDELTGVRMWEGGHSGWEAEDYANRSPNNTSHAATVAAINPHLLLLALGYNDARNGRTVAQFEVDLAKIIDDTRAAGATPSFLIIGYPLPAGVTATLWTQYLTAMQNVATAKGAAWLDLSAAPVTFQTDNVHPDANGHTVIAQQVDTYLAAQVAPVELPKADTLTDDFATRDTSKWTWAAEATVVGGRARIPALSSYPSIRATGRYDLTDSYFGAELATLPPVGNGSAGMLVSIAFNADSSNLAEIGWDASNRILCRERVAGTNSDVWITHDRTAHRWVRIRAAAGTLYWEASPNGTDWSILRSRATSSSLTSVQPALVAGHWMWQEWPGDAEFDNVNLGPPAVLPTVSVGLDEPDHDVGTVFTRTPINTGAAATSHLWMIDDGPTGVATTIGTAETLNWTPTVQGTYTISYTAANDVGSSTDSLDVRVVSVGALVPPVMGAWYEVFADDFTTLDTTKWHLQEGKTQNNITASASNVSVVNGELRLQLSSTTSGAQVTSQQVDGIGHANGQTLPVGGYTEARVWFPGDGTKLYNWSAWWTVGATWPLNGELDIAETFDTSGNLTANYHTGETSGSNPSSTRIHTSQTYMGDSWHRLGVHRKADSADFYWDGVLIGTQVTNDDGGPHALVLTVGYSNEGRDVIGSAGAMRVDWVRVWSPDAPEPALGLASGAWGFAGSASGKTTKTGRPTGAWGFAGSASGRATKTGRSTGAWGFAGSASGKTTRRGQATGAWGFAGSASGKTTRRGQATGAWGFAGSASGRATKTGRSTGAWGFAGSASGRTTKRGLTAGTWGFSTATTGETDRRGIAGGVWGFAGSATGTAPALDAAEGLASGVWGFAGTATGSTTKRGLASGAWGFSGTATGAAPIIDAALGLASGSWGFSGTATGYTSRHGLAEGSWGFQGAASGRAPAGDFGQVIIPISGAFDTDGTGTATFEYDGVGAGMFDGDGVATAAFILDGVGTASFDDEGLGTAAFESDGVSTGAFDNDGIGVGSFA